MARKKEGPGVVRIAGGALTPGVHGLVAGKPGGYRKAKAALSELAGTAVVPTIGGGVAAAIGHDAGWYKDRKVKKNNTLSAFGVDHA